MLFQSAFVLYTFATALPPQALSCKGFRDVTILVLKRDPIDYRTC